MTIALDTSALMAIVLGEEDASHFARVIAENVGDLHASAATLVEAMIVTEARQGPAATQDLEALISRARVTVAPFDTAQASIATAAWRRFGKGRHAASLNMGDCCAYALARSLGAALLFKGDDFAQTDIPSAL